MITVFKRHEKKFILDCRKSAELQTVLQQNMIPDENGKGGKFYSVRNLYFDTPDFDVIRSSLKKPCYKEKLRLRSYGIPADENATVLLEMKKKFHGLVLKRRVKLSFRQAKEFLQSRKYPEQMDAETEQILHEIAYYLSHTPVIPQYLITYDRNAYFDREDRNFRITFDRNLCFCREKPDFLHTVAVEKIVPDDMQIMEVKFSESYPFWFTKIMGRENLHPHSFSKFGVSYKHYLQETLRNGKGINVFGQN